MHGRWLLQHQALGPTGKPLTWGRDGCCVQGWVPGWGARTAPMIALRWAVRPQCPAGMPQDDLLLARRHPWGRDILIFFCFVQDFPVSWCSRAVPAPGSHGLGIAGRAAPSDRLSAKLEGMASSRSPELGVRLGHWCLDQGRRAGERKRKASRAASSSFHHL